MNKLINRGLNHGGCITSLIKGGSHPLKFSFVWITMASSLARLLNLQVPPNRNSISQTDQQITIRIIIKYMVALVP